MKALVEAGEKAVCVTKEKKVEEFLIKVDEWDKRKLSKKEEDKLKHNKTLVEVDGLLLKRVLEVINCFDEGVEGRLFNVLVGVDEDGLILKTDKSIFYFKPEKKEKKKMKCPKCGVEMVKGVYTGYLFCPICGLEV